MSRKIVCLLVVLLSFNQVVAYTYVDGEDYYLPEYIEAEPFSGYVCYDCPNGQSRMSYMGWIDFEPEKGVYNWSDLERRLEITSAANKTMSLHLQSIVVMGGDDELGINVPQQVPDWVFEEYNFSNETLPSVGGNYDIRVVPQWRPEIAQHFNNMIKALGEEYADDPRLESIYLHGISASRGEEFWLKQPYLDNLYDNWNFTPENVENWIKSRMDAYKVGFAGYEYKVAWVGQTKGFHWNNRPDFEPLPEMLLNYAWDQGFGSRNGGVEKYWAWVSEPAYANSLDSQGHMILDESSPIFDGRYWGSENEEYGPNWEWDYGEQHSDPQRYRMAIMRMLQSRVRWSWSHTVPETLNPPLSEYARLSFGKNINNSPDAWALLVETISYHHNPDRELRNFERWLTQRDFSGGITVPTERYERTFDAGNGGWNPPNFYDYTARRTDLASGNNSIYFDVNKDFIVENSSQIKVEIVDNSDTIWRIEYYNSDNELVSSEAIQTINDGLTRTFSVNIVDPLFEDGLEHGMDFKIVVDGPEDLSVKFVRLLRNEFLCEDPSQDCVYSLEDLLVISDTYGLSINNEEFNKNHDYYKDGKINILDIMTVITLF